MLTDGTWATGEGVTGTHRPEPWLWFPRAEPGGWVWGGRARGGVQGVSLAVCCLALGG